MIKSMTHVVLSVVFSFGVLAAGANPSVRADIQAAFHSAGAVFSNVFSSEADLQGSLNGSAEVSRNGASANADLNGSTYAGAEIKSVQASMYTDVQALTNSSASIEYGDTNAAVHAGLDLTGSTDTSVSSNGSANSTTSASADIQAGVNADIHDTFSLDTLLENQSGLELYTSK